MARKSKKLRFTKKTSLISGVAVLAIVAIGLGFWYNSRPSQEVIGVAPTKSPTADTSSQSSQAGASSTTSDKQTPPAGGYSTSSGKGSGATSGTGQPPLTPAGPFVSNHHPGNGSPTTENSVCNTTPGASCYIKFTQGSNTKVLQTGTADSNGAVYWNNWDINSYGFSSGEWTITVVATLNNQTTMATDPTSLTIQ